jgi:nicotinamidase/pyrazinamidase
MNEPIRLLQSDALIVVDVQNDFLPGGALAVAEGDQVIDPMNRCIMAFEQAGLPIFATRDWHPRGHSSFREHGGPWPPHCVQNTPGAAFASRLRLPDSAIVISKADKEDDSYSGFDGTELNERLQALGARRLFIGGLATDYCVLETVLDALDNGFSVCLLEDAIRAVNVNPQDGSEALARMLGRGAEGVQVDQLTP